MKTKFQLTILLSAICISVFGQGFMPGFDMFSHSKPSYLTLNDGTKIEGEIDRLDRKRNNISGIRMEINGEKKLFAPEEVKEMYLPAHSLNKFSLKMESATNTSKDYDLEMINDGYGYFENTEVMLGKKVQTLMMQLVNPGFSDKIKVYFDPMAMETMKVGVGPISAGGIDRSYYIKVGDEPAYKLSKANYDDLFKELYADCPALVEEIGKSPTWKELPEHMFKHASCE